MSLGMTHSDAHGSLLGHDSALRALPFEWFQIFFFPWIYNLALIHIKSHLPLCANPQIHKCFLKSSPIHLVLHIQEEVNTIPKLYG